MKNALCRWRQALLVLARELKPGRRMYSLTTQAFAMKNKVTLERQALGAALLAALLTAGCASLRMANPQATQAREQAQIQERLQDVFAAAESKDFDRLDRYHLYGPKFTKFSGSSPDRLDAAAGRKGEHDGLGAAKGLKMQADALKIDVFDNVGIATFILDYSVESGGKVVSKKDRSTLVFVKEAEEWKIAHEHLTPIGR
ncbi:MAG TPA: nuclear transport factor 2 family protein [Verrucomicrobiae bacterium]